MDIKLTMRQRCALVSQANSTLEYIRKSTEQVEGGNSVLLLSTGETTPALLGPEVDFLPRKMSLPEQVQNRTTNIIKLGTYDI